MDELALVYGRACELVDKGARLDIYLIARCAVYVKMWPMTYNELAYIFENVELYAS